jgi:hypothetical protein
MKRKRTQLKQIKNPSKLPIAPPLHEEPLRGIEPAKISCEICGKAFTGKSQLDRHIINEHESPERNE